MAGVFGAGCASWKIDAAEAQECRCGARVCVFEADVRPGSKSAVRTIIFDMNF